jgi:hypothetical protein
MFENYLHYFMIIYRDFFKKVYRWKKFINVKIQRFENYFKKMTWYVDFEYKGEEI